MNKPQVGQKISLSIHGLGSSGEGVGYSNGYTVFVDGALPGEEIEASLYQCQKRHGFARLISITKSSHDRVTPPCKLFGKCGGCQLMHLSYTKQLEIKRQRVIDALRRIGKIECEVAPCIASPSPLGYRNKIQLPVKGISIGLYARSSHDLIEVENCHIHSKLGEEVYGLIRQIVKRSAVELRHILIKSALRTGEVLVILVTNGVATPLLRTLANEIMGSSAAIKGVVQNIHSGPDNTILGNNYVVLEGNGFIHERLGDLMFKVSPASFFQINPDQAEQLYAKALEFAELNGDETVLDAYCGVGTLSLFFARGAKKVIGVECVKEAIEDAIENGKINGIENATFVCANSEDFVSSLKDMDVVLLNPPRKGCDPAFLDGVGKLAPKKLIYISCDPATLARDLAHLRKFDYEIEGVQPFDMFPQTAHVECVVRLKKFVNSGIP